MGMLRCMGHLRLSGVPDYDLGPSGRGRGIEKALLMGPMRGEERPPEDRKGS